MFDPLVSISICRRRLYHLAAASHEGDKFPLSRKRVRDLCQMTFAGSFFDFLF